MQLEREVEVVGLLQKAVVQHDDLFGKPEGSESGGGTGGGGWALDENNRRKLDETARQGKPGVARSKMPVPTVAPPLHRFQHSLTTVALSSGYNSTLEGRASAFFLK